MIEHFSGGHFCCAALSRPVRFVRNGSPWAASAYPASVPLEDFYEDVFDELAKYGEIEQMNVCDNLGDHLVGSVYVKFADEQSAARAMKALQARRLTQTPSPPSPGSRPLLSTGASVTDASSRAPDLLTEPLLPWAPGKPRVLPGDRLQGGHLPPVRAAHVQHRPLLQLPSHHPAAAGREGAHLWAAEARSVQRVPGGPGRAPRARQGGDPGGPRDGTPRSGPRAVHRAAEGEARFPSLQLCLLISQPWPSPHRCSRTGTGSWMPRARCGGSRSEDTTGRCSLRMTPTRRS